MYSPQFMHLKTQMFLLQNTRCMRKRDRLRIIIVKREVLLGLMINKIRISTNASVGFVWI